MLKEHTNKNSYGSNLHTLLEHQSYANLYIWQLCGFLSSFSFVRIFRGGRRRCRPRGGGRDPASGASGPDNVLQRTTFAYQVIITQTLTDEADAATEDEEAVESSDLDVLRGFLSVTHK